jgi:hypothetical protein
MDAPIEPIRRLGIKAGESWKGFGWIFARVAGLVVLIPTILGIAPSGAPSCGSCHMSQLPSSSQR